MLTYFEAILFCLFVVCTAAKNNCSRLEKAYYCLDRTRFVWCSGNGHGIGMKCDEETVCKCGKTGYNPCVFTFQELPDCTGLPGDYISDEV
uniref:Jessie 1a n=1 Tax=Entamoeba invadens TaxID=33085 RepID=Q2LEB3_ENTIV|nr:Jessie 1a [Entamoeba invadens]